MLTLAKTVFISTLLISLPFGSYEKQNPGRNTTQSTEDVLKTIGNKSIPLESEANITSENEARSASNHPVAEAPLDLSTTSETVNSTNNLLRVNNSEGPRPTSTFSTVSPFLHGFVSRLPLNSSITDKNLGHISAHLDSTYSLSSENHTWVLDNDTLKIPDISSSVTNHAPGSTTTPVTPLTVEPTGLLTTNSDNFAGFTPYQENTTLQPTLIFTNNSKLFPNTSDTQKENKSTGIVFGAILGAILGVSLLSLVGYLLCGKRKTDSFSHRRLYDDRNEPVTTTQL
ncbi:mucin-15 isoform X1 [Nannospalax galili]|uniref:mucin-15 isoform X1 n=1 Tax=Nannospalax galili TaxID=1026970 RepID=UPI0004ED2CDC|nr:mucin-15 isoform X1 [Nannospalax galili]